MINEWQEIKNKAAVIENTITDRIDYIVNFIVQTFNARLYSWCFQDATEECALGNFVFNETYVQVIVGYKEYPKDNFMCLLKDNSEWNLRWGEFPTRFLFEDFEEELVAGKQKYEEKLLEKSQKNKDKEEKKKRALEKVKSKLTNAELKLLGVK